MVRLNGFLPISLLVWLGIPGIAAAQATVEYGLGAARAATTGAGVKGTDKALGGLQNKLDKALNGGQKDADAKAAPAAASKPATTTQATAKAGGPVVNAPPPPKPVYEDPGGITNGLAYDELVRRFGPAAMEISGSAGRSLTYEGKDGMYQLEVQDGKVARIQKPQP